MAHTRDAIHTVLEELAARLDEIEEHNVVPPGIGKALADAGIVRLLAPRAYGGTDATLTESMEILEDIAAVDASVAWRSLVACEVAPVLARLPRPTLDAMYSAGPDFIGGALFAPKGIAVETAGGFRVRGRWPNVTGCDRCVWLAGMCVVADDQGTLRRTAEGSPLLRMAVFPAVNARRAGTWRTTGLHAAGGHDVVVDDVFVPGERTLDLFSLPADPLSTVASLPILSVFSMHAGAVALGVARAALDDVATASGASSATDAARSTLGRARDLLYELGHHLDSWVEDGRAGRTRHRVAARATASWTVAAAGSVVSTALEIGISGTDSEPGRVATLARRFRDVHALSQHIALIQDHLSPGTALPIDAALASA